MSLHAIIDELIELNISLKAEGDEIRLNGSREKLTPAIIERIKINKPELLKFLKIKFH
jgi:TubC N-terminal docking domain